MTDLDPRAELADILSEPRFDAPAPSLWDEIWARAVRWFLSVLGRLIDAVGGPVIAGIIALGVVAVVVGFIAFRVAGRRAAVITHELALERLMEEGADPADLERRAERAERDGDFDTALRLRFVAGLLRLDRAGRIRYTRGLTTTEIAEGLGSPEFDRLRDRFDRVAYGGASADAADLADARRGWDALLERSRT